MSRQLCQRCNYPLATCVCDAISEIKNCVQVIVLQHPCEEKEAKNTARLLALSLQNIRIIRGETPEDFASLQDLPADTTALIYPHHNALAMETAPSTKSLTHLIVLDGTWKKAYKLYQMNPWLTLFPAMCFADVPVNRYAIRKAPRPDSLSTLEAVGYALSLCEGIDPSPLHRLLARFINNQLAGMPVDVRKRYTD